MDIKLSKYFTKELLHFGQLFGEIDLIPKFALLKEWAYAGFLFVMSGAAFSHIASGTVNEIFPSLLLLILTVVS
ncbi:DoxX-like protein [Chitinophaga niastensis]|uniref:DoxX-like protein n=1 Tax=Chitinophaga niastensis TaxID=536980 RepID=A0A2P8HJ77_CHINA|nr:DoxX family protein [Chitinophaga niastensis]PSL46277.1 DoxX-like protein [Chitinophaga niastensis]